jgi:hypothetical protein
VLPPSSKTTLTFFPINPELDSLSFFSLPIFSSHFLLFAFSIAILSGYFAHSEQRSSLLFVVSIVFPHHSHFRYFHAMFSSPHRYSIRNILARRIPSSVPCWFFMNK